jgi:hypothetical protein
VLVLLVTCATLAPELRARAAEPPSDAGSDVRALGAVCDGRSDDAPALRAAYAKLAATGGTLTVPAGVRCAIGGDGVEPRSGVAIRCGSGGGFVALPGARALFRTTATLDDWSVTGCTFDLDGVAAIAWESSGGERGGARWAFRDNTVRGTPPGAGEPSSLVRLDCTIAGGPCTIAGNAIFGSDSPERRDTCLTVTPGGFIGFNTQVLGNYVHGCGGDCLAVRAPGGVTANGNTLVRCFDNAVDDASLNSVWTGNQLATSGAGAGAALLIHDTIGNQVIVGNQLAVNPRTRAPAVHAIADARGNVAGIYLDANYAAQGVFLDARGRCEGGSCGGGACDDDAGCGACGGRCTDFGTFDHDHVANLIVTGEIRVENATNLVVQGNVVIGTAGDGSSSAIRLVNPRAERPNGGILVADNQIGKRTGARSDLACIEIDDAGGGGFAGVTLTGNSCGEDPALAPPGRAVQPVGVRLTRTPRTWRSVLIANNNFGATREGLAGFASPGVRAATRVSGNVGTGAGDAPSLADAGSGSPDVRIAHLRADVVRAESGVPAPEPGLALEVAAHATYAIEGHLRLRAGSPATGLALDLGAPRGASASIVARASGDAAGVLLTGSAATLPLAGGDDAVSLAGTLSTGEAGTFALHWAQGTARPSPLVLQSGSWLRATRLPDHRGADAAPTPQPGDAGSSS